MSPLFFLTPRRRSALPEQSKVALGQARFYAQISGLFCRGRLSASLFCPDESRTRLVVDAHEVEDGGVDVVDVRFVHHGLEADSSVSP